MASQAAIKQKAAEHAAKGEYNLAIEEYNKLLAENDNDAAVHNLVADTYLKMGDKDQAIVEFERAVEIYREDAFYTNAIAVCKKILRTDRERSSVYQDMADLYANEGLLGEAVANYKEFADRMKARGDMEKVFVTYQKIKEIMPKKVDIRLALVDMYLARNRNEDAVSELREVGKLFREQDKIEDAEGVESRIIALGGSLGLERVAGAPKEEKKQADVDFYAQFENVPPGLRETGAETGAATAETVTAEPQAPPGETVEVAPDTEIKFEQTMSDLEAEKTEAPAETVPEAAVSESVEAGVDVVRVEEEISAPAEETAEPEEVKAEAAPALTEEELVAESSKADYEPIFKSSPTDWASYVELGDLCLSVGSTDEALGYFYQAGDAYFNEKSFERATEIYRKIAEIKPMELRPRQRLVQIAQKKGDAQVMVEAYTGLADCLERRGAAKEASTVYKKLLDIDPENEVARAKLSAEAGQPARAFAEEVPEPQPAEAGPEGKDRPQV
ncbi:MAG: tetratricopeptide repeat protein, partial [bacterium]